MGGMAMGTETPTGVLSLRPQLLITHARLATLGDEPALIEDGALFIEEAIEETGFSHIDPPNNDSINTIHPQLSLGMGGYDFSNRFN